MCAFQVPAVLCLNAEQEIRMCRLVLDRPEIDEIVQVPDHRQVNQGYEHERLCFPVVADVLSMAIWSE